MKLVMKTEELSDVIKTLGVIKDESVSVCIQPTNVRDTAVITLITTDSKGLVVIGKVNAASEGEVNATILELGIEFITCCCRMKVAEISLEVEQEKDKNIQVTLTDGTSRIKLDIKESRNRQIPKVDSEGMLCQMEIQTSTLRDALEKVMWSMAPKTSENSVICIAFTRLEDESYKAELMTTDGKAVSLIELKDIENIVFSEEASKEELLKYCLYSSVTDIVKTFAYDKCRIFITNKNMAILQNGPCMIHLPLSSAKMPYREMDKLYAGKANCSTIKLQKEEIQYAISMIEVGDYDRSISNIALNIEKHETGYFLVSPNGKVECPLKAADSGDGEFTYVSYKLDKLKALLGTLGERITLDVTKPEAPTFFQSTEGERFILMPCKKYVSK